MGLKWDRMRKYKYVKLEFPKEEERTRESRLEVSG